MRIDPGEREKLRRRQDYARDTFASLLRHVGDSEVPSYWRAVEVPYAVQFAYEEVLAPLVEDPLDPKTTLAALVRLASYLTDGDVTAYRLPLAPERREQILRAFARTPSAIEAPKPPSETEQERLVREADEALARLDERERALARGALLRLVRLGRPEEGAGVFPIQARLDDFEAGQNAVLEKLGGLVVRTSRKEKSGEPIAVAAWRDERLPVLWPTLRAWAEEGRDFLTWRQQLRGYLTDWARSGRERGALLSGALLSEALLWSVKRPGEVNAEERAYLEASREANAAPPPAVASGMSADHIAPAPGATHGAAGGPLPAAGRSGLRWAVVAAISLALGGVVTYAWKVGYPPFAKPIAVQPTTVPVKPAYAAQVEALLGEGDRALQSGRAADALDRFRAALRLDPSSAAALVGLGRSQAQLGDAAHAYVSFEQAAARAPLDPVPHYASGLTRLAQGDNARAIASLDRAIELAPNNAEYRAARAVGLEQTGRIDDAMKDYTAAIALEPGSARYYFERARLQEKAGDRAAAAADYRTVIALAQDESSLQAAQKRLQELKVDVGTTPSPNARGDRLLLHYRSTGDRGAMGRLRAALRSSLPRVEVPGAELVSGPTNGDVRFFFPEDQPLALRAKAAVETALATEGVRIRLRLWPLEGRRFARARPGTVEVWLPSLAGPSLPAFGNVNEFQPAILWVDDQPDNNASLRLALENAGATVVLSRSTEDAAGLLEKRKFDLVISDMGRPSSPTAGYDLLQVVRRGRQPPPFLIYSTGGSQAQNRAVAEKAGAAGSTDNPAELIDMVQAQIPGFRVGTRGDPRQSAPSAR